MIHTALQLHRSAKVIEPINGLTCNGLGAATFASRDHDQELHQAIIDFTATALYYEDVLIPNRCVDTDRSLAIAEFLEFAVGKAGT